MLAQLALCVDRVNYHKPVSWRGKKKGKRVLSNWKPQLCLLVSRVCTCAVVPGWTQRTTSQYCWSLSWQARFTIQIHRKRINSLPSNNIFSHIWASLSVWFRTIAIAVLWLSKTLWKAITSFSSYSFLCSYRNFLFLILSFLSEPFNT